MKYYLILIFLVMSSVCSFGQRIKYRDYKEVISLKNYGERINHERYSPILAVSLNLLFPTSGYIYVGEPLRGAAVFGGEVLASGLIVSGVVLAMASDINTGQSPKEARPLLFSGILVRSLIGIWSQYDVVRIAMIKNLAYQERNISMDLTPDLLLLSDAGNKTAIYGLKLCLRF